MINIQDIKNLKNQDGFFDIDLQFADFITKHIEQEEPLLYLGAAITSYYLRNSHICVDLNRIAGTNFPEYKSGIELLYPETEFTQIKLPELNEWIEALNQFPQLVSQENNTPLILEKSNRLYFHRYWNYESKLSNSLINKCKTDLNRINNFPKNCICDVSEYFRDISPDELDWQQLAIFTALVNDFTLITGGPGTGKTTVASAILSLLIDNNPNLKIRLCAPTGKAASRLKESINDELENLNPVYPETKNILANLESHTIHRLLEVIRLTPHFHRNKENPIPAEIIIIDEASMIPLTLFSKLMDSVHKSAKIILLGDKDQLASVEAGAVLANIYEASEPNYFSKEFINSFNSFMNQNHSIHISDKNHPLINSVIELQKSRRFDDSKGIGLLKSAINNFDMMTENEFLKVINTSSDELKFSSLPTHVKLEFQLRNYINTLSLDIDNQTIFFKDYLNQPNVESAYKIFSEFRILCSHYISKFGARIINNYIHNFFFGNISLTKGVPIMITENNNQLELYNGDIGLLWPDENGKLKAFFPQIGSYNFRAFSISILPVYDEVFAMTIHKSQGSGFQKVLIILPDRNSPILTRELIYTGITRAKQFCEIWCKENVFTESVYRKTNRDSGFNG